MAFAQALELARSKCKATVKAFTQPSGDCGGHTAIWIRRRAARKEFFDTAKGFSRDTLAKLPLITNHILTTQGKRDVKAKSLMSKQARDVKNYNEAPKKLNLENELQILKALDSEDFDDIMRIAELEVLLLIDEPDRDQWLIDYLGSDKRASGRLQEEVKEAPSKKGPLNSGEGIIELAEESSNRFCFVGMGAGFGATGHAVGLDRWSNPGKIAYFDPNMGEAEMPEDEFGAWMSIAWLNYFGPEYDKYDNFVARVFTAYEVRTD